MASNIDPTLWDQPGDIAKEDIKAKLATPAKEEIEALQVQVGDLETGGVIGGGTEWFTGAGTPDSGVGTDGDFYLDTDNGDVYEKVGVAWSLIGNIKGPNGDPFVIDAQDTLANRSAHDAELKGFTFLATDTGDVYFKLSDTSADWSAAFSWQGPTGATGAAGATGPAGPAGESFVIDAQDTLANRINYDAELEGFTFLATDTGDVYFKLSDTSADWSVAFPWQGPAGASAGFSFDAVVADLAGRAAHDGEVEGFTVFVEDSELVYVKRSATSADWTDGISLKGPAGGTAVTIVELTTDHTLTATDIEGKLLRYNTPSNFSVRVPTALKSIGSVVWPFSVVNYGTGTISVVPETGGGGGAEPVVHQTWKFEEAKLFETAPNGSLENGGSITIPAGLADRYLVVFAMTSSGTVEGVPDASATFGGTPMTVIQKAPAWVNQQAVRAFAFGMIAPPEGTATVSVTFTGPSRVFASSVVAVLLTGVDQSVPFEGQAGSDADGVAVLNQVLSTSIPANCLILGAATKLRGSATVVATASTYLDNGNCASTSDSSMRWIVAAESGGAGGAGLDLNFEWNSTKQQSGIAAAFRPGTAGGATVIAAAGEFAHTAGQFHRMTCYYEAFDQGGGMPGYNCFTEGGALTI